MKTSRRAWYGPHHTIIVCKRTESTSGKRFIPDVCNKSAGHFWVHCAGGVHSHKQILYPEIINFRDHMRRSNTMEVIRNLSRKIYLANAFQMFPVFLVPLGRFLERIVAPYGFPPFTFSIQIRKSEFWIGEL